MSAAKRKKSAVKKELSLAEEEFIRNQKEIKLALERQKLCEERKEKINLKEIKQLSKDYKATCQEAKRAIQKRQQEEEAKKPAGKTRSGRVRGVVQKPFYTDGKWAIKGMDDAKQLFKDDEVEFLKRKISKIDHVENLNFDQLKYLIIHLILPDLKEVRNGNIDSYFHRRYNELKGKSKQGLRSDIRLGLFTCDQQAYINGLLAGAFDLGCKNEAGDIKHEEMDYVKLVMVAEAAMRVIMLIHKFDTVKEAHKFAVRKSREAMGIEDNECEDSDGDW